MEKEAEKELLSIDEFDKLVETGGIEAGRKYVISLINKIPSGKLPDLWLGIQNIAEDAIISTAKDIEHIDVPTDEQIAHIAEGLFIKMSGKGASAEDTLHEILSSEGIELHHNTFQKVIDKYNEWHPVE